MIRIARRAAAVAAATTLTVGLLGAVPAEAKAPVRAVPVTAAHTGSAYGALCVNLIIWVVCI